MLLKCCTQYASNNGKLSSGHRTRKVQFSFQSQRKECQRMFKFPHNCTHFTCYQEIMLKILQVRLQEYINGELSDVQAGFRKGRGTRVQIANICWIIEKAREFQKKTSTSASLTTLKPWLVDHNKLWQILKEMGIPDHLTCLLRNLYSGQEATVRCKNGKMDWF